MHSTHRQGSPCCSGQLALQGLALQLLNALLQILQQVKKIGGLYQGTVKGMWRTIRKAMVPVHHVIDDGLNHIAAKSCCP